MCCGQSGLMGLWGERGAPAGGSGQVFGQGVGVMEQVVLAWGHGAQR